MDIHKHQDVMDIVDLTDIKDTPTDNVVIIVILDIPAIKEIRGSLMFASACWPTNMVIIEFEYLGQFITTLENIFGRKGLDDGKREINKM